MSRTLQVEFSDEDFQPIEDAARQAGMSPEQWVAQQSMALAPSAARRQLAFRTLREQIESVEVGSIDNESIDRDLAREYGNVDQSDAA